MRRKEKSTYEKIMKELDKKPTPKLTKKEQEALDKIWEKLSEKEK
jgi:hypothetical protein